MSEPRPIDPTIPIKWQDNEGNWHDLPPFESATIEENDDGFIIRGQFPAPNVCEVIGPVYRCKIKKVRRGKKNGIERVDLVLESTKERLS